LKARILPVDVVLPVDAGPRLESMAHRLGRSKPTRDWNKCGVSVSVASSGLSERSTVKSREKGKRRSVGRHAKVAAEANSGVGHPDRVAYAKSLGYSKEELKTVPADAVVSRGCGIPVARARLRRGEVVLDLGSGAGLDVFSRRVWSAPQDGSSVWTRRVRR